MRHSNVTCTTVPTWQLECEAFLHVGIPFEVHNVSTAEQVEFVAAFGAKHDLKATKTGTTVRLERFGD